MENNKFNKVYLKDTTSELIDKLRSHRTGGLTLDREWYQALKKHLSERPLSLDKQKEIDYILSPDFLDLEKALEEQNPNEINLKTLKTNLAINPVNIISAGRAIKGVVYLVLIVIGIALFAFVIVSSSSNMDTIKNTYIFCGIASLTFNILILVQLYSAGDDLEKSVFVK